MTMREEFEAWRKQQSDTGPWLTWQAAYRAGQEAMKERAAKTCEERPSMNGTAFAAHIRALPVDV